MPRRLDSSRRLTISLLLFFASLAVFNWPILKSISPPSGNGSLFYTLYLIWAAIIAALFLIRPKGGRDA